MASPSCRGSSKTGTGANRFRGKLGQDLENLSPSSSYDTLPSPPLIRSQSSPIAPDFAELVPHDRRRRRPLWRDRGWDEQ